MLMGSENITLQAQKWKECEEMDGNWGETETYISSFPVIAASSPSPSLEMRQGQNPWEWEWRWRTTSFLCIMRSWIYAWKWDEASKPLKKLFMQNYDSAYLTCWELLSAFIFTLLYLLPSWLCWKCSLRERKKTNWFRSGKGKQGKSPHSIASEWGEIDSSQSSKGNVEIVVNSFTFPAKWGSTLDEKKSRKRHLKKARDINVNGKAVAVLAMQSQSSPPRNEWLKVPNWNWNNPRSRKGETIKGNYLPDLWRSWWNHRTGL